MVTTMATKVGGIRENEERVGEERLRKISKGRLQEILVLFCLTHYIQKLLLAISIAKMIE